MIRKVLCGAGALGTSLFAATAAFAQDAAASAAAAVATASPSPEATSSAAAAATSLIKAPTAEQMATMVNKGDVAWMLVSAALVLMMSVPALALFYGGLVRTKNMLSVLMQVFMIVSIAGLVWCCWGYSLAFTSGSTPFFGGLSKAFLMGVSGSTYAATFSNNVYLPEFVFVVFQMTFAMITPALIVGAFAERVKFTPLMVFMVLWLTFIYFPIAHMVWYWAGPDFLPDAPNDYGFLWGMGALDFAGGTVVHINAGIAGLVGCLMIGKRIGFGREATPPHSLTMTMIGASLLWVGWFGFNAGSNLEANSGAALPFLNTILATAAAALSWIGAEAVFKGKPSTLGGASGAVAGLVAITPACGTIGPMAAIVLGLMAGVVCLWGVHGLKSLLGADDALDVFGVHGVGGILGAIMTGVFTAPSLGGTGAADFSIASQVLVQAKAVLITIVLSGIVSAIAYKLVDLVIGLRVSVEEEREGLDLASHGERAYND